MFNFDLYLLRDEKAILDNPHKGWYWHYIDCGYKRPRYRDDTELIGDVSAFPGLKQLYLRFDWCDINPEKGIFDFSYLDEIIDKWGAKGFRFSMRMCTFQTEVMRWNNNQRATPDYVRKAGARGYDYINNAWEPDYSDDIFLGYVGETITRLGEKYGGDDRIEYFDIGTFGRYGEGHTNNKLYGIDLLRRHIDIHRNAFKNKLIMVNDDMLHHNMPLCGELADYCLDNNIGLRDDSICVAGVARSVQGYDTLRDPKLFDIFCGKPVDIEFAHSELIPEDVWLGGFPALEALKRTHASYAGFHDYPGRFLKNNGAFAEYAANRLGYWYRPDRLELNADGNGNVTVTNLGWADSYHDYKLKLRLTTPGGSNLDIGTIGDSGKWKSGIETTQKFKLDFTGLSGGYGVQIGLFYGQAPVKLALNGKYYDNGYYEVGKINL